MGMTENSQNGECEAYWGTELNLKTKCLYTRPAVCIGSSGICTWPMFWSTCLLCRLTMGSIIGWTRGQVPHCLKRGDVMCFLPPHFLGQQIFIMCKFAIFLLLILREMDITLRGCRISLCISGLVKVAILTCARSVSSIAEIIVIITRT